MWKFMSCPRKRRRPFPINCSFYFFLLLLKRSIVARKEGVVRFPWVLCFIGWVGNGRGLRRRNIPLPSLTFYANSAAAASPSALYHPSLTKTIVCPSSPRQCCGRRRKATREGRKSWCMEGEGRGRYRLQGGKRKGEE